jgi:hypothetical protein
MENLGRTLNMNVLTMLSDREGFRRQVIETLARTPVDFVDQFELIFGHRKTEPAYAGRGILLPLYFRKERDRDGSSTGQYVFLLSKRPKVKGVGDRTAPSLEELKCHKFKNDLPGSHFWVSYT